MKKLFLIAGACLMLGACGPEKQDPNAAAMPLLETARTLMFQKNYQAARDSIQQMRTMFPTALEVRHQGILVMDSIELLQTQDSLNVLYEVLDVEQQKLDSISKLNNRGKNSPFYDQKNKVFYLRQSIDELNAKTKFFIRKIEEDKKPASALES